ncbi:MAG: hypothetical protein A2X36_04070 [Elusimicrobia bacterium GWA2_69_24]|nr:MAG: hypothetical protein A2X36_04070 [Elusimicrobia bacterium GWA2_69_24]HBL17864.1 hypothetical protein [Elusimicrobiota bacterium]
MSSRTFIVLAALAGLLKADYAAAQESVRLSSTPPVAIGLSDFIGLDRVEVWRTSASSETFLYAMFTQKPLTVQNLSFQLAEVGTFRVRVFDAAGNPASMRVVIDTQAPTGFVDRMEWSQSCGRQVPSRIAGSVQDDVSGAQAIRWGIHDRSADLSWDGTSWVSGMSLPREEPVSGPAGRWEVELPRVAWPDRHAEMSVWISASDVVGNGAIARAAWDFSIADADCRASP